MSHIERIPCGGGNCYLIRQGNHAVLVDTSQDGFQQKILSACQGTKVTLIVLTHGHIDHVQNAAYLAKELGAPIAMHQADYGLTRDNQSQPLHAHSLLGKVVLAASIKSFQRNIIPPFEPAVYLKEGDSLEAYGVPAVVVALPGHTQGSIGLQVGDKALMVGDALMNMLYPTKTLIYNNRDVMEQSAKRISSFKQATLYFGHGKPLLNRDW